ncbi:MAG: MFS transporter [Candidatus Moraniibacteriota bacterium]|jgi:MFS transporter
MNFKYFNGNVSKDLTYLYISRTITYFSNGFFSIFLPIFLYITLGDNAQLTLLFYLIGSTICVFLYPFTTKHLEKYNLKNSLYIATIANVLFLLTLSVTTSENIHITIYIAMLFLTIFRMLYWVPYHTTFTTFSDQNNRMREVSFFQATLHITGIISPLIAGIIITQSSYQVLFLVGIAIYSLSLIPLLSLSNVYEKFSWGYIQTWKKLFSKKYRAVMIAYYADGIESGVGMVIWPIFIYELLNGDFVSIGIISTLTISITVILELSLGKYADTKKNKKDVLRFNSILYSIGWVAKIFVITGFQIFIADAYHKITQALSKNTLAAITYDIAADEGHYVDEFTVLKEMALHIGRSTLYLTAIVLLFLIDIQWLFLIAALAALAVNSIRLYKK